MIWSTASSLNGGIIPKRHIVNRRAFLYGAGGVALGLPFLEGMPERSAWAADASPVFTFFLVTACGVEPKRFWPTGTGALSGLLSSGKAVDALKDYADNLVIIKNMNFPLTNPSGCGHAQGLVQSLTAKSPTGNANMATATGPSVDYVISKAVNPAGTDPLTLYAGNVKNTYIADRVSFDDGGRVRASVDNPYKLYQTLTGLAAPAGGTGTGTGTGTTTNPMAEELIKKRKSVNDLVRKQLAEAAHAEIDQLRMQTLARGLKHFKDRGLQDKSIIVWTNHIAEGFHTMKNVPFLVWGNGGGKLKQNQLLDAGGQNNGALFNVVISAATGKATTDFGASAGKEFTAIKV